MVYISSFSQGKSRKYDSEDSRYKVQLTNMTPQSDDKQNPAFIDEDPCQTTTEPQCKEDATDKTSGDVIDENPAWDKISIQRLIEVLLLL